MTAIQEWLLKVLISELPHIITPELLRVFFTEGVAWLRTEAGKTQTGLDDSAVEILAKALGV